MLKSPPQRVRLNPQGLARRDQSLMRSIVPNDGDIFVSCDLSSGEPTVTAHYSQDKNYYDACFGMVGKEPYFSDQGLLKIDNLYLTFMSQTSMGRHLIQDIAQWGGHADRFKELHPQSYAFHKMGVLGFGYGMGPRKFQSAAYDAGHVITFAEAKSLYNAYWSLFPGLRNFAKHCEKTYTDKGYLVNDFGYRLLPDKGYKAFNYYIQSSVSGIMHVLCAQFFALAPWCTFLFVIHDEIIFSCAREREEEARTLMKQAEDALNEMLKWRVRVRVGFKKGDNLYEAK